MNEKQSRNLDSHKHSVHPSYGRSIGGSDYGSLWGTFENVMILVLGLVIFSIASIFDKKPEV